MTIYARSSQLPSVYYVFITRKLVSKVEQIAKTNFEQDKIGEADSTSTQNHYDAFVALQ